MINMPYGYSQKARLKIVQGSSQNIERFSILDEEEVIYGIESIIGTEILEDFHEHEYQTKDIKNDTIKAMIYF